MRAVRVLALGAAMIIGSGSAVHAQQADSAARSGVEQEKTKGKVGGRRDGRRARPAAILFRGIELSAEQRTQAQAIREKYRAERIQLRQRLAAARTEGQRPDSTQRAAFRQAVTQLVQRQHGELRAILTDSQRTTFDANVQEMQRRMAERRERGERGERGWRGRRGGRPQGSGEAGGQSGR